MREKCFVQTNTFPIRVTSRTETPFNPIDGLCNYAIIRMKMRQNQAPIAERTICL